MKIITLSREQRAVSGNCEAKVPQRRSTEYELPCSRTAKYLVGKRKLCRVHMKVETK